MQEVETEIGYKFKDSRYLKTALIHSSYANKSNEVEGDNERLEFLGDSVLSVIVAEHLFVSYPQLDEGELTKLRSSLVCEKSLYKFATLINLSKYLRVSIKDLAAKPSVLADAFEALIAAIYLDAGLRFARRFVLQFVKPALKAGSPEVFIDYKTILQEVVQRDSEDHVKYLLVKESGPPHKKEFTIRACLRPSGRVVGEGQAGSKKEAAQEAAKEALKFMGYDDGQISLI
ncbi:MAG: ribonuclease III [Oscillospiraceae bacterium]|jgi:ribonuclease-3|nr:ribonuclease III [Oscillospiraceae bacterium]